MKKLILGSVILLCGVVLYAARLIAGSILAQYTGFHNLDSGLKMTHQSLFQIIIIILIGLALAIYGIFERESD